MIAVKRQNIPLRTAAEKIRLSESFGELAEIRLRAGRRAVAVNTSGGMCCCSEPFSEKEIGDCFAELCRYSVHSYTEEIAQGYITLDGGHRVGICGTAVTAHGKIAGIKDISSLNIRIAHEVKGWAGEIYVRFFRKQISSLLLAGKPMSGKTTVLRDLARLIGADRKVTVIDSRNEISASVHGRAVLDVGLNTDVLCGCGKSEGIMLALRSMSPDVIICDEIGDDSDAVRDCMFCGVKLVAAVHAGSLDELSRRSGISSLLRLFDAAAVIGNRGILLESSVQN